MKSPSEALLIQACIERTDESGWDNFIRSYSRIIWHAIQKSFLVNCYVFTKEDVEDIFAELFLSLIKNNYKKLRSFHENYSCSISTWLTIMATRMTIDHIRKHGKSRLMDGVEEIVRHIADTARSAEEILEEQELLQKIDKAEAQLSEQERNVFHIVFRKGLRPELAAEVLGISPETLYTKKHRLVGKIKKIVASL